MGRRGRRRPDARTAPAGLDRPRAGRGNRRPGTSSTSAPAKGLPSPNCFAVIPIGAPAPGWTRRFRCLDAHADAADRVRRSRHVRSRFLRRSWSRPASSPPTSSSARARSTTSLRTSSPAPIATVPRAAEPRADGSSTSTMSARAGDWEQRYRRVRDQFTGPSSRGSCNPHREDEPLHPRVPTTCSCSSAQGSRRSTSRGEFLHRVDRSSSAGLDRAGEGVAGGRLAARCSRR